MPFGMPAMASVKKLPVSGRLDICKPCCVNSCRMPGGAASDYDYGGADRITITKPGKLTEDPRCAVSGSENLSSAGQNTHLPAMGKDCLE